MSSWTYINGTITVSPIGRTQPEKKYILDTENLMEIAGGLQKIADTKENEVRLDGEINA